MKTKDSREFIQRTAAGLRAMKAVPDFLLFIDFKTEWIYDEDTLCNIPVLHTEIVLNSGYDGEDFIIHPVFKNETPMNEINRFQRAFKDYNYEN